jgi:hypothetical protein
MKKILPFLALMMTLAGPLAYADSDNKDSAASTSNSQPTAQSEQNGCPVNQDSKQNKQKNKAIPSDQEKEFERVLMGIYG